MWRFILWLLLLGGLVVLAVAVPIGGRTLWERINGPAEAARPAGEPAPAAAASDQLTEKDREGLNRLIENKLEPKAKEGGEDPHPPGK